MHPLLNITLPSTGETKMYAYREDVHYLPESSPADGAHLHSCFEIYMNLSGNVSFLHNREIYDIQSGDIVLSHPSDIHYCIHRAACIHSHYCLWFTNPMIEDFLIRRHLRGRIRPTGESRQRIAWLLEALGNGETDEFLRVSYLFEVITLLDSRGERTVPADMSEGMRSILKYVDENLSSLSGAAGLAQAFFLSESTLNRMFRAEVGMSFGKYLEARKLSYAESLLCAGNSVTEACYLAGFTDCSRFIAKFKEKYGITPLKYKKSKSEARQY